jgi:ankyrin repeat protein
MSLDSELVREFVIAGHGDLEKVQQMLAAQPGLLNAVHQWGENDFETAVQAAAHVGNAEIAEYLLSQGAPLEICTAAMLGRQEVIKRILEEDADAINATGAHGIPLLTHAALSGDLKLVQWLVGRGALAGASSALHNVVRGGNYEIARWLLENTKPDLTMKDFQGKTPLMVALGRNDEPLAQLLREHGAVE